MLNKIYKTITEILKLQKKQITFSDFDNLSIENYKTTYNYFTKPHRLKLIKNKTIGVALIDIDDYNSDFDSYLKSINGKNSAAYYQRKSIKRGYAFEEIDKNDFIDDIYEINTSATMRQGHKMGDSYIKKIEKYEHKSNFKYYGILKDGKLHAYCDIGFYGEFALISRLLGHKKYLNDGIMYHMLISLAKLIFEKYKTNHQCRYIMYDTFFGASEGLKQFKNKLNYRPYKVKWKWGN